MNDTGRLQLQSPGISYVQNLFDPGLFTGLGVLAAVFIFIPAASVFTFAAKHHKMAAPWAVGG